MYTHETYRILYKIYTHKTYTYAAYTVTQHVLYRMYEYTEQISLSGVPYTIALKIVLIEPHCHVALAAAKFNQPYI
jgi:hypothetical protein